MFDADNVTRSYLITQIWTGLHYAEQDAEPVSLDDIVNDPDDLPEEIRAAAARDVADFLRLIDDEGLTFDAAAHWDDDQLGHDFSLTRNGHGAGFWDRGRGDIGDKLTALAHSYGDSTLYSDPSGIYAEGC